MFFSAATSSKQYPMKSKTFRLGLDNTANVLPVLMIQQLRNMGYLNTGYINTACDYYVFQEKRVRTPDVSKFFSEQGAKHSCA